METNIITLNATIPTFKNKALNTCTEVIYSAAREYNQTAAETRKVIAKSLNDIENGKLYKDDDCKSLAEYAARIGLEKSLAHKLENAGRMINSKDETIREFALAADWSKLAIMASADDDSIKEAIETGAVKTDSTQAEVKSWKTAHNAKKAASKPALVPDYKVVFHVYGPGNMGDERIEERVALQSPKDFPEYVGYKPLTVVKAEDDDGVTFYTAILNDHSVLSYTLERLAKADKKAKASKPDFSTLDDAAFAELLKEAARRGIKAE